MSDGKDNLADRAPQGDRARSGGVWAVTRHLDFIGDQITALKLVFRRFRALARRRPPV
jgi:hypothetical protein